MDNLYASPRVGKRRSISFRISSAQWTASAITETHSDSVVLSQLSSSQDYRHDPDHAVEVLGHVPK
jgi:hypothetical protein